MNKCELCGLGGEELNIRERDDSDGIPHLVCDHCYNELFSDFCEPPTKEDFYDMEVAEEMD